MRVERVAVLSDVHGNLTAFQAVLDDLGRRGIDTVVNLGDVVGKGPRGSACVALSRERCATTVRGNWDEWLGGEPLHLPRDDRDLARAVQWWHDELDPADRGWLRDLPFSADLVLGGAAVRFVHASMEGVWTRVWREHSAEEAAGFFDAAAGPAPTVACYGDLHLAYVERTPSGLLVNVGSAGNPLDEPRASYVVLGATDDEPTVEFVRVAYDVEAEVAAAERSAMPLAAAWARELREAYYRGRTD